MKKGKDLIIITCPPLSDFKEAPKDQSDCELFDCPRCKNKMWLSEKKKGLILFSSCIGRDIFLGCYPCAKKYIEENPDIFLEGEEVRI